MSGTQLPRSFYARPAEVVAPELLGKILCHRLSVERRAYLLRRTGGHGESASPPGVVVAGDGDAMQQARADSGGAAVPTKNSGSEDVTLSGRIVEVEAYKGQIDPGSHAFRGETPRNRVMFGPPGYVYVYISYGQHRCMNVVTESPGIAGAVLIRALEPIEGIAVMEALRGGKPVVDLANGPGKLCQALGIMLADNGEDLEGNEIWIEDDRFRPAEVATSTRVGLTAGADMELRFYIAGNPYASKGRPSQNQRPVDRR